MFTNHLVFPHCNPYFTWDEEKTLWNFLYDEKISKSLTNFILPSLYASVNTDEFPAFFKLADVIPVFKKGSKKFEKVTKGQ